MQCDTSSPQGDHVTAYALVDHGLYRIVGSISEEEIHSLSVLDHRNALRRRRSRLYDFVSAIAVIDLDRKDFLYKALDQDLQSYHQDRVKKLTIKQEVTKLHGDPLARGDAYEGALKWHEQSFRQNGEKMRVLFCSASALALTFYNKIPHTAFEEFKDYKDPPGQIKTAISKLDTEVAEWIKKQEQGNVQQEQGSVPVSESAKNNHIKEYMQHLIHYPQISESVLNKQSQAKGKRYCPRNNDKEILIKLLCRHVHIFFAVYPEMKRRFDLNDELLDYFVEFFIETKPNKEKPEQNWPMFKNKEDMQSIKEGVKAGVSKLSDLLEEHHYTHVWRASQPDANMDSSDDEEISTEPISTKASAEGGKDAAVVELLKRFEEIKEIIRENKKDIPKTVMDEFYRVLRTAPCPVSPCAA
jgi:hypothetical protein